MNVPPFNQQIYEQQAARVRSSSDSPESADLVIRNNATVYVTTQHPTSVASENASGLRYAAASDVQYENYDNYQQHHHQTVHPNAHGNGNGDENIKIELIRNQHPIHGKVHSNTFTNTFIYVVQCLRHFYHGIGFFFSQIHIEDVSQQPSPQTEKNVQYTNLDVSPQNYYNISTDGYQPTGSGFTYLSTSSNKDYSIYQGSPNTVLYKGLCFCFSSALIFSFQLCLKIVAI